MSSSNEPESCAQCGARGGSRTCEDSFHALLAFENERPTAFAAVHHLTVPAFYLQHPRGYGSAALDAWHRTLADSLDGTATPRELATRARRAFNGATRLRDPLHRLPDAWPRHWSMTIGDVFVPGDLPAVDAYVERALAWANAVRLDLERAGVMRAVQR